MAAASTTASLVLTVDDDGRGISIADRCRLFQPFFTTKAHGTGLGLFVSRQILEDHAGTLSFRSEPGQGSTFLCGCPLEPAALEELARRRRAGPSTRDRDRGEPSMAAATAALGDEPS